MSKINSALSKRMGSNNTQSNKGATELAQRSIQGSLSGFAGVFNVNELTPIEKDGIKAILNKYNSKSYTDTEEDLHSLISLTSEVKAITNQAAILHGERIKRAQDILKPYLDGAFSAWLKLTYGNRQTPYNFLYYYEFYKNAPKSLIPYIEAIPRQAVYTLASRKGSHEIKENIIKNAQGKSKCEIIEMIQVALPIKDSDNRKSDEGNKILKLLKNVQNQLSKRPNISEDQRKQIHLLLSKIKSLA